MIIIDSGHGGNDPGAVSHGVSEKDWTLEVSIYQYKRLKELGVPVALTRNEDVTLDSVERTNIVKSSGAQYCISNHFNAGGGSGCETIHSIFSNDHLAEKIARAIAGVGMPFRRVFSREGSNGFDYYYMHRMTGSVKTIIVEYGFLDSDHDFRLLNERREREKFAEAVVEVLCRWMDHDYHRPSGGKPNELDDVRSGSVSGSGAGGFYRVQVGAFKKKRNAVRLKEELEEKGYPVIIKH